MEAPEQELARIEASGKTHAFGVELSYLRELRRSCAERAIREEMLRRGHWPSMRDPARCAKCEFQLTEHMREARG